MQTMCIDDSVDEFSGKAVTKELPSFHGKAEQLSTQLQVLQRLLQFSVNCISTGTERLTAGYGRSMTSSWIICITKPVCEMSAHW